MEHANAFVPNWFQLVRLFHIVSSCFQQSDANSVACINHMASWSSWNAKMIFNFVFKNLPRNDPEPRAEFKWEKRRTAISGRPCQEGICTLAVAVPGIFFDVWTQKSLGGGLEAGFFSIFSASAKNFWTPNLTYPSP